MATFRQRGDAWRAEISVNGTRESATFDTKTQARAWASKRETELRELSRGKLPDYTLNCAIERYIAEVCPKHKGCDAEIKRFRAFQKNFPKLCKKHIAKITTNDFVTWRDERLKKVKPASVRREGNILSALFTVARTEWKWVYESPMSDLKMPPPPAHRDRRIAEDEIERLCLAADFNNQAPENFTQQIIIAFLLALETAMRAGEIRGLTWDRVYLKDRYVTLDETKNGTKRHVPLSKRAVELLELMGSTE